MSTETEPALAACRIVADEHQRMAMRLADLRSRRDHAIRAANAHGFGYRRIARATGISVARVQQIVNAAVRDEDR